jgi:hypothetical protein
MSVLALKKTLLGLFIYVLLALTVVYIGFNLGSTPKEKELSDDDLVSILKVLSLECESELSENLTYFTLDVSIFKEERIENFILWAQEKYKESSFYFIIKTDEETYYTYSDDNSPVLPGGLSGDAIPRAQFVVNTPKGDGKNMCSIMVDVKFFQTTAFVNDSPFVGTYTFEKKRNLWGITKKDEEWLKEDD